MSILAFQGILGPAYKAFAYPACKGVTNSDASIFKNALISPSFFVNQGGREGRVCHFDYSLTLLAELGEVIDKSKALSVGRVSSCSLDLAV